MNDRPDPHDLHDLLAHATDAIERPHLAGTALREAHRRRVRRRGAAAAFVASAAVVGVVATTLGGSLVADPAPPPQGTPTPTGTPSGTPSPDDGRTGPATWPTFDPRTAPDLPPAPDDLAPALPRVVDPPASAPSVAQDPMPAAVVASVDRDAGLVRLLGTDGRWRTQAVSQETPSAALSPSGTSLVVWDYVAYDASVVDLTTGEDRTVPPPDPAAVGVLEAPNWLWLDDETLTTVGFDRSFVVDADTGTAERAPFDLGGLSSAVDSDGAVMTSAQWTTPNVLTDWAGGEPREVSMERTGRLSYLAADDDGTVAGTSYDGRPFAVVADRRTLTPWALLPVRDRGAAYSNGGLSVLGLAEDDTVLLRVARLGTGDYAGFDVVAFDPGTGEVSLVSSLSSGDAFAAGLLREVAAPPPPDPEPPVADPVEPADVQTAWDPDDVESLPWDDTLGLPRDLSVGVGAAERGAARAVAVADGAVSVLGPAGWYVGAELPDGVGDDATVAIAPDGSRFAVVDGDVLAVSTDDGWTTLPLPRAFSGAGDFYTDLDFVGTDRLLLGEWNRFWEIDVAGGDAVRLPFDVIDEVVPAGGDVLADRYSDTEVNVLERWRDGTATVLGDLSALESTQRPASDGASLVTVRADGGYYGGQPDVTDTDGLLALDLDGLTVRGFLPVPSRASFYSDNANLTPLGFTDPDTVLAEVRPAGSPGTTWLVTWAVGTGEVHRVASFPTDQPRLALALDALGAD
ncbi:hypothetical protein GCM10023340_31690 [Nocardioides marinquilinus]|uniref:WD40 repeat domain-containing protein n=1 Tax=Nocardioides marinquilinus TaxID=1210400 RepID=A0ABP9PWV6_9ACTN